MKRVKKIEEYKPYNGFYDLRDYNLPKKVFLKLWKIQEYLNHVNERNDYFQKMDAITWREAQELSADYQQCLFSHSTHNDGGERKGRPEPTTPDLFQ